MKRKILALLLAVCAAFALFGVAACKKKDTKCSKYDIYASYDAETCTLTGTVDFTYYNNTDNETSELKFNLYGNAFRENALHKPVSSSYETRAYYSGKSYGG
ncbi:MAG: hypothetical protein K2O41_03165, partial [Clostridia bacterium]|nr:hypothetical protein [Clostridia bacterium]